MLNSLTAETPNQRCPSSMLRAAAAALVALTLALAVPAWSAIEISGAIATDTTLEAGATYHVTGTLTVGADAILTVPAGTVLKANSGVRIQVDGGLVANGTAGAPVHFTEVRDSSVGTDLDPESDPAPGGWFGIDIRNDGSATLNEVRLRYAGTTHSVTFPQSIVKTGAG
ncbi:MAG: hypothetical protein EA418_04365, partial [Wenzhouxiangellaceae bacterium]